MDTTPERPAPHESGLVSRRALVRAGAAVAWSVPLVQVVAAAPAAATGSGHSNLTATVLTASYASASTLRFTGSVSNTGVTPTSLQITVLLPSGVTASDAVVNSGSWAKPGAVSGGSVVFTATGTPPGGSFDITLTVSATTGGTLTVTPSATNQGSVTAGSQPVSGASFTTTLTQTSVSAAYATTDASLLKVKTTVTNGSGAATSALKLKVSIPSSKYNQQPTVTGPTGWSTTAPTVAAGSGTWDVTFTADAQLAANGSKTLDATITLNDASDAVKYAGTTYTVTLAPTPGNGTGSSSTPTVAATGSSTLAVTGVAGGSSVPAISPGSANKTYKVNLGVANKGPKLISNVTVTVKLSRAATALNSVASGWTNVTAASEKTTWTFQRTASVTVKPGQVSSDPAPEFAFSANNVPTATYGASAPTPPPSRRRRPGAPLRARLVVGSRCRRPGGADGARESHAAAARSLRRP